MAPIPVFLLLPMFLSWQSESNPCLTYLRCQCLFISPAFLFSLLSALHKEFKNLICRQLPAASGLNVGGFGNRPKHFFIWFHAQFGKVDDISVYLLSTETDLCLYCSSVISMLPI